MNDGSRESGDFLGVEPGLHHTNRINPRSPREAIQPEPAPEPPRRSRQVRHPVVVAMNFILSLILLAAVAGGVFIYWGKVEFEAKGPLREDQTIVVRKGTGLEAISAQLERRGVVSNSTVFAIGVRIYQKGAKMRAGEYLFEANSSMRQVMNVIVAGRGVDHHVTIPEGLTSEQIIGLLQQDKILVGDIKAIPEEGVLLPETYRFTRGTTRLQMVERMKRAHDRALATAWERRADGLPVSSPRELLILASIVEKETGRADERTRVASVFVNRLRGNMRLESDPTIIYGLYGGKAWEKGRVIKRSEKARPNVYSTYQIKGLPPGPIANPGKAALEAVANPSRTKDIFFVADGTGGHIFARTFEEHKRNVQRWRNLRKKRQAAKKKAENEAKSGTTGSD